jgi:putative tryptophan/tyrosine transport system substrate-binding protein
LQEFNKIKKWLFIAAIAICITCCFHRNSNVPVVGFADAFQDNTIEQAKTGFIDAMLKDGFDEKKGTLKIIYRNAQGNIPTLTQIIKYFVSQQVTLIATNPSLSTITAVQNTKDIPIFMMVSPTPALMKVNNARGNPPINLFGVGETLDYIDTSFLLIPKVLKAKSGRLTVGMIFNQSEPQSVESMDRIQRLANENNINLISQPVNSSADVLMVTASLLSKNIDVFFANPDNIVFESFETILQSCNKKNIPIFTSEAGLVERGALAAYGADIYQWGYQAGRQAAQYLKTKSTIGLHWETVLVRKKVYNTAAAKKFGINIPSNFQPVQ